MSSLPAGKFQPMPRCSTMTPSGCSRPAVKEGSPSQDTNQTSPCEAELRPRSKGSYRFSLASPRGTLAASGQLRMSSGSEALKIFWTSVPWLSPRGLNSCAPVVSPAHSAFASEPMIPASCKPELNTYWSAVPLGQNPPPIVDELRESTQISPVVEMPQ